MKLKRQNAIKQIIEQNAVSKQDELLALLLTSGFEATQATVSRDIKELSLMKIASKDGVYRYTLPKNTSDGSKFSQMISDAVVSVDYSANIVLVKCQTGMANAVCKLFDDQKWQGAIGTLSGDDTFMVITKGEEVSAQITAKLTALTNQ